MVEFLETFDPNEVPEDDRSFDPIPAGEYLMQVIESEIKSTKSGSGEQLVLTLEVVEGPCANRRVWDRLNIRNQNADAQRIAQRSLADLCLAVGVMSLRDTEDLHFKPFIGKVTIKTDKSGQYGPQNAVRYKPRGGQPPAGKSAPQGQSAARPSSAPSAGSGQSAGRTSLATTASPSRAAAGGGSRPWSR
ncbi:hypothetical protein RHODGE_RHODGE_01003 [Rhodoplanes serenus]|uniref:DUF669 domain-containing protein n=1 Tax=Rhodoplanes serenus TaxID=200615 RepID=A0A3S5CY10_9BRAD|nr:DUF669 domain-containing protein [Rhodoplanes serenus]VCU06606.1 hypothetical protein RHODPL_RHODPL_00055 [Rhodoplanes serenus]VCU07853.1 hypothetical protein RHODGE_RHODGE_01003 [Rhodoplanes serenus]